MPAASAERRPGQDEPLRVLIVAERALVSEGIEASLGDRVAIVARASSPERAVGMALLDPPDVAVIDLGIWPLLGLDFVRALRELGVGIVGITTRTEVEFLPPAIEAGIGAYLLDDDDHLPLADAVDYVTKEAGCLVDKRLQPAFAAHMAGRLSRRRKLQIGDLSQRELDIVGLLTQGYEDDEIGVELGLSRRTVQDHMLRIRSALNARNRVEAAARASELGLGRRSR